MIIFEAIGAVSITKMGIHIVGRQIDCLVDGIQPVYGLLPDEMGVKSFVMTIKWGW